jgi:hypothetical protein
VITDTHGTWLAGRDGPAAMIMPADPKVGDVYRPENIPGLVFEEVTVKAVGRTLPGPLGPVKGGLVIEELHLLDNTREMKTFAPGYGEFLTGGGGDIEALTLALPTDALSGPTPAELMRLERSAMQVVEVVQAKRWPVARRELARMTGAWSRIRAGEVPDRIEARMNAELASLERALRRRNAATAGGSAIEVARLSLDLQLRHRPVAEVDLARFGLWAAQLSLDAAAGDTAGITGDLFTLDYIRDRIHRSLSRAELARLNTELEELSGAVADTERAAVRESAAKLVAMVAELERRR